MHPSQLSFVSQLKISPPKEESVGDSRQKETPLSGMFQSRTSTNFRCIIDINSLRI